MNAIQEQNICLFYYTYTNRLASKLLNNQYQLILSTMTNQFLVFSRTMIILEKSIGHYFVQSFYDRKKQQAKLIYQVCDEFEQLVLRFFMPWYIFCALRNCINLRLASHTSLCRVNLAN